MPGIKFIINPVAGARSSIKKWRHIQNILRHLELRFDYQITEGAGHAIELAKEAVIQGYEHIFAVGGDGTVNEVANGILESGNAFSCALGIISTGTGSDFVRSAGISRNYIEACHRTCNTRPHVIDVGIIECWNSGKKVRRYFVNTAGIGLDAAVVAATNKYPKLLGGTIPYLIGLVRTLITYKNKNITLKYNGAEEKLKVVSVIIANGKFAGGGMQFAPTAQLNDGFLDVVIVKDMSKAKLIRSFPRVYKGTHLALPEIFSVRTGDIFVNPNERTLVYADGELLGEGPIMVKIIPAALKIVT